MTKHVDQSPWANPVIYMSRVTARHLWRIMHGTALDLSQAGDLRFGDAEVLYDDRMEIGVSRILESPECDAHFAAEREGTTMTQPEQNQQPEQQQPQQPAQPQQEQQPQQDQGLADRHAVDEQDANPEQNPA